MALFGKHDGTAREGATLLATALIGWMPELEPEAFSDDEGDDG